MCTVHDVAAYILKKYNPLTTMKLQKLVYYAQAWSLVWDERPLFPERIEAWANGPVVPELYEKHKGQFELSEWPWGDPGKLDAKAKETVDAVLKFYARHKAQWLSDLAHREKPWKSARVGLSDGDRGSREITIGSLCDYYSNLK